MIFKVDANGIHWGKKCRNIDFRSLCLSMGTNSANLEKLLEEINKARNRMQRLWAEKGYTDDEVLAASIEVDRLLNEYDRTLGFFNAGSGRR